MGTAVSHLTVLERARQLVPLLHQLVARAAAAGAITAEEADRLTAKLAAVERDLGGPDGQDLADGFIGQVRETLGPAIQQRMAEIRAARRGLPAPDGDRLSPWEPYGVDGLWVTPFAGLSQGIQLMACGGVS
jgi:hypothetical protein